jgi:hypothetical protein
LAAQEVILYRSAHLFKTYTQVRRVEIECEYIRDFSLRARQTWDEQGFGYLTYFTASIAFELLRATFA